MESFDIVAVCGNKVERCFDNVACCFDILLLAWTGPYLDPHDNSEPYYYWLVYTHSVGARLVTVAGVCRRLSSYVTLAYAT